MKERYWCVSHNADLTETGMPMNRTYLKTIWQGFPMQQFAEKEILEDFCFSRFGKKTGYVQGIAAVPNWTIREIEEQDFIKAIPIKWGGYKTTTIQLELGIGNRSKVEILKEREV